MIKCDPRAKARCPFKEPCCGDEDEMGYFLEGSDCDKFNQKVCAPPPTNADRIRAMSDEKLAEFLVNCHPTFCLQCAFSVGWRCKPDRKDYSDFEKCVEGHKRWLQQPAEEAQ